MTSTPIPPVLQTPILKTDRLILREPRSTDFDAFADFYGDARSWGTGGPLDRQAAWRAYAMNQGHWILRGYGLWTVEEKETDAVAGRVGFWHPLDWPEVEIGWTLYDGFEGKGYAYEAVVAARRYAYDVLGWAPMISVIDPANSRSIKLAERLGAQVEPSDWTSPSGRPTLIYRHPSAMDLAEASE